MTPFETISVVILITGLAGSFVFGGIHIGKWMSDKSGGPS